MFVISAVAFLRLHLSVMSKWCFTMNTLDKFQINLD